MTYISRTLQKKVLDLSAEYAAILVTGPRQVGKTTMLQALMAEGQQREYVTLDDFTARDMAQSDPAMFFQIHKPPVLIDEVQYAPQLFPYIKMLVDKNHRPGDFWLTGSQLYRLMSGVQESLAGRVALLNLFSLSQVEIDGLQLSPFRISLEQFIKEKNLVPVRTTPDVFMEIWQGSMPALRSGSVSDRDIFYSSYISTYIERDVRDVVSAIDSLKFVRFLTAVAARDSQLINYKGIADDADINQATVKNWLNILETLGLIFYLHPYSNNTLKRTIKTPKLYFYDTGLVCYLTKWSSPETAMVGAMSGALFENYVVSEIIKSYCHHGKTPYMYYYRDRDQKEIDVILEQDGMLFPIEIKKTAHPEKRMATAFNVLDKTGMKKGTGAIICTSEALGAVDKDVLVVPVGHLG